MLVENVPLARDHRLRKQAGALIDDGFDVTVICRRDPANAACLPQARVLDYPAPREGSHPLAFVVEYGYSLVMATLLTVRTLILQGIDVVQIASTPDIYFVLAVPLRLLGKPVVFDFRDLSPETYRARFDDAGGGRMFRLLCWLERRSLRTADQVLVVNEALAEVARTRAQVPRTRITVVGNGPVLDRAVRLPPDPQLRQGKPYLCCWIGMIGPQDRVDLALRAVHHLVHALGRMDTAFTFVGVGDALADAQRLTDELGIRSWVSFPGWAEEEQVFEYLSTADLGLEPNLDDFVSPVKVLEYMAAGLPFVAFDSTQTRRLADGAAVLVPPRDIEAMAAQLDALLRDEPRRRELGGIGQTRVRKTLAWEHQRDNYLVVFRSTTTDAAGRRARGDGPVRRREGVAMPRIWQSSALSARLLRARVPWILLVTAVVVAATWIVAERQVARYVSTAEVNVETRVFPNTTPLPPNMATERQLVAAGVVLDQAAATLRRDPGELLSDLSITVPADTTFLDIACDAATPQQAQRCAGVVASAYVEYRHAAASGNGGQTDRPAGTTGQPAAEPTLDAVLVSPPTLPDTPAGTPEVTLLGIGALLGLALGIGSAFLRDRFDDRVRGRADAEQHLGEPVVACVPRAKKATMPAQVVVRRPASPAAESFRYVRVRLESLLWVDGAAPAAGTGTPGKIVLVTSGRAGEGSTTVASNTALGFALAGRRTILVDADVAHSGVADLYGVDGGPGLVDLLSGTASPSDVLRPSPWSQLRLVSHGSPEMRRRDLFGVARLRAAFGVLAAEADVVVVDCAGVLAVSDALAMAMVSDVVLLTIDVRHTTRKRVAEAAASLRSVAAPRVLGLLNSVRPREVPRDRRPSATTRQDRSVLPGSGRGPAPLRADRHGQSPVDGRGDEGADLGEAHQVRTRPVEPDGSAETRH
jgi:Mrp family chromosome partitioning ATPase/glycosyltransferase involved in cell wall biosynthesis/capsular polysaccharide biosynthesis protein